MSAQTYLIQGMDTDRQHLRAPLVISFVAHIMIFFFFVGMPHLGPKRSRSSRVINVRMVSLPSPQTPAAPKAAPAAPQAPPEPIVKQTAPAPDNAPIVKPSPQKAPAPKVQKKLAVGPKTVKKKTSLKKKTYKREKIVQSALKKVEKRVETSRPDPIQKALDSIKEKVERGERKTPSETASEANGVSGPRHATGTGPQTLDLLDIYQAEIPYYIQKNWAFSEQLAGGRTDLLAVLVIKIMGDGEIRDIWFEQRSGNQYLDESAFKAIQKSNPLPPLPKGITRSFIQVGLRFTPSGLN